MKRNITWYYSAWQEYIQWQNTDKKILRKINQIVEDIERDAFNGIGKPEALRGDLSGTWSRRINDKHRLLYIVYPQAITIISCYGHYDDK